MQCEKNARIYIFLIIYFLHYIFGRARISIDTQNMRSFLTKDQMNEQEAVS